MKKVKYHFEGEFDIDEQIVETEYYGSLKGYIEEMLAKQFYDLCPADVHYDIINEEEVTNA